MGDVVERMFAGMRGGLIHAVEYAGPWALPALGVLALVLAVTHRDKVVSPAGLFVILSFAALAVTVRAIQLGRF
jgi:hypothetical protein